MEKKRTLDEILKENQARAWNRQQEQKRRQEREERKEAILFTFIAGAILTGLWLLLNVQYNDSIKSCMEIHDRITCERGV